ncbi:MAG: hypothetical protein ABIG96_02710 [Candidatus Micrarchaeota archaeon]
MERGQTAIEYLMLIGAAIFFVIVVSLTVRNVVFPVGKDIGDVGGNIASAKASWTGTSTPIITPFDTNCIPNSLCGTESYRNDTCPSGYGVVPCETICYRRCSADGLTCLPCTPSICNAECISYSEPYCRIIAVPSGGEEPLYTAVIASFFNLPGSSFSSARISCDGNDESDFGPPDISREEFHLIVKYCNYPANGADDTFTAWARAGSVICKKDIQDQVPAASSPSPSASPSASASPSSSPTASPSSSPSASASPSSSSSPSAPPSASPSASPSPTIPPNFPTPICDVNACDLVTQQFFDFRVLPNYRPPAPTEIRIFEPAQLCNNGGGPCKSYPCRVRGSQLGENICALIEDFNDFDWNDFVFSTKVTHYADWTMLFEVKNEACDTAADDQLRVEFNFPISKFVRNINNGVTDRGTNTEFQVFPLCRYRIGNVTAFFISDNAITNTPPIWANMPLQDYVYIGNNLPSLDIWNFVGDNSPDSALSFSLTSQTAPSVINCWIRANRYLECGPALAVGNTTVTIRATDLGGYYSEREKTVRTAILQFDIPSRAVYSGTMTLTWDLRQYASDTKYTDDQLLFLITDQTNPGIMNCFIASETIWDPERILTCWTNGFLTGSNFVTVRAVNLNGIMVEDTMEMTVVRTPSPSGTGGGRT